MRISKMDSRIDLRTDPQIKHCLELAAFLGGYASLSKFMLQAAEDKAQDILQHLENKPLSDRDRDLLLKLLEKSPEPNDALKQAYAKVNASYRTIGDTIVQDVDPSFFKKIKQSREKTPIKKLVKKEKPIRTAPSITNKKKKAVK